MNFAKLPDLLHRSLLIYEPLSRFVVSSRFISSSPALPVLRFLASRPTCKTCSMAAVWCCRWRSHSSCATVRHRISADRGPPPGARASCRGIPKPNQNIEGFKKPPTLQRPPERRLSAASAAAHSDYDSLAWDFGAMTARDRRGSFCRGSVVNIHLMRAPEALRCCCQNTLETATALGLNLFLKRTEMAAQLRPLE